MVTQHEGLGYSGTVGLLSRLRLARAKVELVTTNNRYGVVTSSMVFTPTAGTIIADTCVLECPRPTLMMRQDCCTKSSN